MTANRNEFNPGAIVLSNARVTRVDYIGRRRPLDWRATSDVIPHLAERLAHLFVRVLMYIYNLNYSGL